MWQSSRQILPILSTQLWCSPNDSKRLRDKFLWDNHTSHEVTALVPCSHCSFLRLEEITYFKLRFLRSNIKNIIQQQSLISIWIIQAECIVVSSKNNAKYLNSGNNLIDMVLAVSCIIDSLPVLYIMTSKVALATRMVVENDQWFRALSKCIQSPSNKVPTPHTLGTRKLWAVCSSPVTVRTGCLFDISLHFLSTISFGAALFCSI